MPGGRRGRSGPYGGVGGRPRGDHRAGSVRSATPHIAPRRERDGAECSSTSLWAAGNTPSLLYQPIAVPR